MTRLVIVMHMVDRPWIVHSTQHLRDFHFFCLLAFRRFIDDRLEKRIHLVLSHIDSLFADFFVLQASQLVSNGSIRLLRMVHNGWSCNVRVAFERLLERYLRCEDRRHSVVDDRLDERRLQVRQFDQRTLR